MSEEVDAHVEKRYELVQRIGKGAYGIVWRAMDKKTRQVVALKKVFDAFSNQTDAQRTYREVMFLQRVTHENIIKLTNVLRAENKMDLYLVFEFMDTDLHATIRGNILQDVHKQFVTYQILRCIRFLHRTQIIHRDLKPANVLLNGDCHVKLADFGLARSMATLNQDQQNQRPVLTDYIATRWYRPPEIVLGSVYYSRGVDMWAVGCVIAEMLTGRPLFPGTSTMNQLERIIASVGHPNAQDIESMRSSYSESMLTNLSAITPKPVKNMLSAFNREAVDLVAKLLVFNPEKRLTAAQAMAHPYVAGFRIPDDEAPDPEHTPPILLPLPDFERFSVDEYREALHKDIVRRKKELKRKRKERKATREGKGGREGVSGEGGGGEQHYEDDYEENDAQ